MMAMMVVATGVSEAAAVRGCGFRRVAARVIGDRVDPLMRHFVGRPKNLTKSFPAAGDDGGGGRVVAGGCRKIWGRRENYIFDLLSACHRFDMSQTTASSHMLPIRPIFQIQNGPSSVIPLEKSNENSNGPIRRRSPPIRQAHRTVITCLNGGYPEEDPSKEHDPKDEGAKQDESFEDSDETEPFEENETAATPPPPRSPQTRIPFSQTTLPAAMIRMRGDIPEEDMPPRSRFLEHLEVQYDLVILVEGRQKGLIRSPCHDTRTIQEAAEHSKDVAQVRRKESEDFYTQLLDARTDRRDIRLEIDVVRGQRTAYETELHEVRQAYLSSEARNRALLARLETLETHMSRMEWQRQRAEDDAVRQIMRTQVLEARARIDMVEDAGSSFIIIISICIDIVIISHVHCILVIIRIMPVTRQGTNDAMTPESIQAMIDRAIQRNSTQDDGSQSSGGGIRRPVQPARVCSYPDFMKCQPLNFKGTEGVVGLSHWLLK
ncbi:hypothetical protein Tco_0629071 [Tanacetum coccineum]|uniref:Uncharacterized protein n=1 Tax=Tanacetum coccineum TaxID=301880 RepID=A0ABQ4WS30_9ASTR